MNLSLKKCSSCNKATYPEAEGGILTFYDHFPDCPEASIISSIVLGTVGKVMRWFLGPETTELGVKYEGLVPLPDDVNIPMDIELYRGSGEMVMDY